MKKKNTGDMLAFEMNNHLEKPAWSQNFKVKQASLEGSFSTKEVLNFILENSKKLDRIGFNKSAIKLIEAAEIFIKETK